MNRVYECALAAKLMSALPDGTFRAEIAHPNALFDFARLLLNDKPKGDIEFMERIVRLACEEGEMK